jgi:HSP20 family protein
MKMIERAFNPMTLWNPFALVTDFSPVWDSPFIAPAELNISEDDKKFTVRMDIPGFRKEDIKVKAGKGTLEVSGRQSRESRTDGGYECGYSTFSRSIPLPPNASAGRLSTVFNNGVLEVSVPKKKGYASGRRRQRNPKTANS